MPSLKKKTKHVCMLPPVPSHPVCSSCYQTNVGVCLPTTTNRQILKVEDGEKGKGFLFRCGMIWENGRLLSQSPSPLGNPEENPAVLRQTKTKGSMLSSVSHLKYHLWEPQVATEWSSRQLSFSPSHCQASGSFLELTCEAGATIGHCGFQGQKVL